MFCLHKFWRLDVQDQGGSRVHSLWEFWRRILSVLLHLLLLVFWKVVHFLISSSITLISVSTFTWRCSTNVFLCWNVLLNKSTSDIWLEPTLMSSSEVTAYAMTLCVCVHVCLCLVAQSYPTLCDPMDCSLQAPLSMGFPRQEYWHELPFPSSGDLPDPGTEPVSPVTPALAADYSLPVPPGKLMQRPYFQTRLWSEVLA